MYVYQGTGTDGIAERSYFALGAGGVGSIPAPSTIEGWRNGSAPLCTAFDFIRHEP